MSIVWVGKSRFTGHNRSWTVDTWTVKSGSPPYPAWRRPCRRSNWDDWSDTLRPAGETRGQADQWQPPDSPHPAPLYPPRGTSLCPFLYHHFCWYESLLISNASQWVSNKRAGSLNCLKCARLIWDDAAIWDWPGGRAVSIWDWPAEGFWDCDALSGGGWGGTVSGAASADCALRYSLPFHRRAGGWPDRAGERTESRESRGERG